MEIKKSQTQKPGMNKSDPTCTTSDVRAISTGKAGSKAAAGTAKMGFNTLIF